VQRVASCAAKSQTSKLRVSAAFFLLCPPQRLIQSQLITAAEPSLGHSQPLKKMSELDVMYHLTHSIDHLTKAQPPTNIKQSCWFLAQIYIRSTTAICRTTHSRIRTLHAAAQACHHHGGPLTSARLSVHAICAGNQAHRNHLDAARSINGEYEGHTSRSSACSLYWKTSWTPCLLFFTKLNMLSGLPCCVMNVRHIPKFLLP